MRNARLLAAAGLVFLTGFAPSADAADTLSINFRLGRRPLTRTLTVTLQPIETPPPGEDVSVEDPSVRLTSDLNGPSGQFPSGQITLSAAALGGSLVQVTAVADPLEPEQVRHGDYQGSLVVSAPGFTAQTFDMEVKVGDRSRGYHVPRVWGALALGGIFGTVAKWLNDTGLALYPVRRRYREIESRLTNMITALPRDFRALRTAAATAIREGDIAAAQANVALLETYVGGALKLAQSTKRLQDRHRDHEVLARKRGIDHLDLVRELLNAEAARVDELRRTALPAISATNRATRQEEQRATFVGEVLRCVSPDSLPSPLRTVLTKLCKDDYAAAVAAWTKIAESQKHEWAEAAEDIVPQAEPVRDTAPAGAGTRTVHRRRTSALRRFMAARQAFQDHVIDHVKFYAGLLLVVFTSIVGYNERYLDDPGFVGRQTQYFGLFFYAAAIPLGGLQVVQLLGRVWPSPGSSSAPPPAATAAEVPVEEAAEEPAAEEEPT